MGTQAGAESIMRIGLDIDGVIYPWHYSVYRYFTEFRGFEGTEPEFWDFFRTLSESRQEYFVSIATLYLNQVPTQDALTYVPMLANLGELYYITSRPEHLKWATQKFFNMYDLPFKENVIFSKDKATYVRLLGLKYFLDDIPSNVKSLQGLTNAYLFKSSHNLNQREGFNVLGTIKEFYDIVAEN